MPDATQTRILDISPVGRVEGDLDVRVEVHNGVVVDAWTTAELFRGLEIILRGKDPQAGLIVTPRACGICGASHLSCAAWALDTAWGTMVPRNAILARNLGQMAETFLQSIPRHHYGLFSIDYTSPAFARSRYHEEAVRRWAPYTGKHYEIGLTISGRPVEIYALFGGQWPHSSYMVPGGVMCAPTLTDVTRAWSILEHVRRAWLEPVWLGCPIERYEEIRSYDDFMAWLEEKREHAESDLGLFWRMSLDLGLEGFGRGLDRFITYGYLPHEDRYGQPTIAARAAALVRRGGIFDGASNQVVPADQAAFREDVAHSWYDEPAHARHPLERTTTPIAHNERDFDAQYSWSTAVLHEKEGRLEAGPLARQLVSGHGPVEAWHYHDPLVLDLYRHFGGASVMLRQFARVHEFVGLYRETERTLREFRLNDPWYVKPNAVDGRGWGATEAARGALCHWIDVEGGKIKNYQIVSPTTWNIGPRDGEGRRGPIETALIGTPVADSANPIEVAMVCRSFDSCMVCTVHAHDRTSGAELARFRTA